ncbi:MAG: CAP domain-containing protein [Chromatiaceae bacterium]|nr:CAP domain-containing protein [Chromatiaceae bacterium]
MRLVCCCLLLVWSATPAAAPPVEFDLVNKLRVQAGLPALQEEAALTAAATLHARYLDRHREPGSSAKGLSAHTELPADAGFSGATPADRAMAAGYSHREVLENVSMGYMDAQAAIDGLMSALYHRLTFLDLEADQLGVALSGQARVFVLGRADLAGLCAAPPDAALSRTPLDCLGQPMTRAYYEALCASLPPQALFRPAHPVACPNGGRLDAGFMAGVCQELPRAAQFRGHGRYYLPCENATKVDATWFDALCEDPPAGAAYPDSGTYYEICDGPRRVRAEWFEAQCAGLPAQARYTDSGIYRRPCAGPADIRVEYLDQLDLVRQRDLPEFVTWPPDGAARIPPAFFIEQPDPLPDRGWSGYPVTIQFNPGKVGKVELRAFRLFHDEDRSDTQVEQVRLLDQASDPNHLLTGYEFALFPLQRLAWGGTYRAVVEALVDGVARRFEWRFVTQGQGLPVLTAASPLQRFTVRPGVDYLLYLPPQEHRPQTVLSTRAEHLRGNQITLEAVDPNTVRVRVEARRCDRFKIEFDSGRVVELIPAGCGG